MQQVLDRLQKEIAGLPPGVVQFAIVAVIGMIVLLILRRILSRRKQGLKEDMSNLTIDVSKLPEQGPAAESPVLEFYNMPVRLAVVVVAPTGRVGELPAMNQLPALLDHAVPGLADVVQAQKPVIHRWPPQLSAEGFARTVFINAELPGDHGKGTPWCTVAGRFKLQSRSFMVALVMRTAKKNNFAETVIRKEHEWLGILRVTNK